MILTIRKQLYNFLLFLIFILAWCPKTPVVLLHLKIWMELTVRIKKLQVRYFSLKMLLLTFKKNLVFLLCLTGTVDKQVQFKIPKFIIYAAMTAYSHDDHSQDIRADSYLHETHSSVHQILLILLLSLRSDGI